MDNLTHALAGMLLAEAAVQLRSARGQSSSAQASPESAMAWRSAAYVASVVGNNLPDLDILWSGVTPRPFGYLLHHRGHSHTLPAALACTALLLTAVTAFARWRRLHGSRADQLWMFALCLLAPLVHIAMDTSNNYGTHPFWPFYRGWIYGDFVFIVEPFFWAAGIPPLLFATRSAITRLTLLAVLAFGVGLAFFVPFVPRPMAVALAVVALACTGAAWRVRPEVRALLGVGACLAVAASFFAASRKAAAAVVDALGEDMDFVDLVLTPMPANPLCFTALTVHGQQDYVVRRATVAIWPSILPPAQCPDTDEHPTAHFSRNTARQTAHVHWRGEYRAPLGELRALNRDNCQAAALLRFFRVPYWVREDGETLIFGDLRYDRSPGLDFSDVRIEEKPSLCPTPVPSWTPPRRDLLDAE